MKGGLVETVESVVDMVFYMFFSYKRKEKMLK